eukprot:m.119723 g.119723  ORF g.119723 m.119723 type:complete len:426 (-) comp9562_c1_seq4:293-1570(-)
MEKLKKFIEQKQTDRKFKKAGDGHALGTREELEAQQQARAEALATSQAPQGRRSGDAAMSEARAMAAKRAMERVAPAPSRPKSVVAAERAAMRAEMAAAAEAEQLAAAAAASRRPVVIEDQPHLRFLCSVCGEHVPKPQTTAHFKACLAELHRELPLEASVKMIFSLAPSDTARQQCVDGLCRYLRNILANPAEAKFRTVPLTNKMVKERLLPCDGAVEFFLAVGFVRQTESEAEILRLPEEAPLDILELGQALLESGKAVEMRLDRDIHVWQPGQKGMEKLNIPDEFLEVTADDVKLQYQQRQAEKDRELTLRTQAMREADRSRGKRIYKYTIIRIRLPNQYILQGTFEARNTVSELYQFAASALEQEGCEFSLQLPGAGKFDDLTQSLKEAQLVPMALLNLHFSTPGSDCTLKPELLRTARAL